MKKFILPALLAMFMFSCSESNDIEPTPEGPEFVDPGYSNPKFVDPGYTNPQPVDPGYTNPDNGEENN